MDTEDEIAELMAFDFGYGATEGAAGDEIVAAIGATECSLGVFFFGCGGSRGADGGFLRSDGGADCRCLSFEL